MQAHDSVFEPSILSLRAALEEQLGSVGALLGQARRSVPGFSRTHWLPSQQHVTLRLGSWSCVDDIYTFVASLSEVCFPSHFPPP